MQFLSPNRFGVFRSGLKWHRLQSVGFHLILPDDAQSSLLRDAPPHMGAESRRLKSVPLKSRAYGTAEAVPYKDF